MSRMQIGAVFPQTEIGHDVGGVRAYLQAAQDLGYQHLLAYDHVLGADPAGHPGWTPHYTHQDMFHEPFTLFAWAAAVAPRLAPATAVIVLPQRQTALVAKQAAQVDLLAGGRLRLGVGIGRNHVEYEALGANFQNRARRFEEQVALLRRLWQEPVVTFEGRYHRVTAAGINPLPLQRPIPIWMGGAAEPALRRIARLADGFFPQRALDDDWDATLARMREWRREAGRDPASLAVEARINAGSGDQDTWRREAEAWRQRGATFVSVNTMGGGFATPDAHVQRLREAMAALGSLAAAAGR